MLPDMSDVLEEFEQTVQIKTVATTTIDFEPTTIVASDPIEAVVQMADKEQLNIDSIDFSKQYIWVHSTNELLEGKFIEWHGKDFKLIKGGDDYSDYGYYAYIGAETLNDLLVAS